MLLCTGLGCLLIVSFRMSLGELRKFIVTDTAYRPWALYIYSITTFPFSHYVVLIPEKHWILCKQTPGVVKSVCGL